MKIGDLIKTTARGISLPSNWFGIIIKRESDMLFYVMFSDGRIRDLRLNEFEVVNESR